MKRKLVAYFSATSITKRVAEKMAQALKADLYEIKPQVPYTEKDLDWLNQNSRTTQEQNDATCRPRLMDKNAHIDAYDTIFLGYPIWWYIAPRIIQTFLESYNFSGKTLVLFATSGGSPLSGTINPLIPSISSSAQIIPWRLLNGGPTINDIANWLKDIKP